MSESSLVADLSQHTVMPDAERGWICVPPAVQCARSCLAFRPRLLSAILEYVVLAWSLLCSVV